MRARAASDVTSRVFTPVMATSVILLTIPFDDLKRDDVERESEEEKHEAEREGRQRLGAVEFLVSDQNGLDLHREGGDRLKRIEGEVGGKARGHDHDHGLA